VTDTEGLSVATLRMLFVCTANIARSPYAERRAAQLLSERGRDGESVAVVSAGVPGVPGRGMDFEMAAQLRERGGEPNGHVSRVLTREMLTDTDLVITFEFAHRLRIVEAWPEHAIKIFGIRQLADAVGRLACPGRGLELLDQAFSVVSPDGMQWDVGDPHRRGAAAARACAAQIDEALSVIVPTLAGRPDALA
jgi:protein-tyrosine-phosphatase